MVDSHDALLEFGLLLFWMLPQFGQVCVGMDWPLSTGPTSPISLAYRMNYFNPLHKPADFSHRLLAFLKFVSIFSSLRSNFEKSFGLELSVSSSDSIFALGFQSCSGSYSCSASFHGSRTMFLQLMNCSSVSCLLLLLQESVSQFNSLGRVAV